MKYFSGFCFQNEEEIFQDWLEESDLCVSGFSYGAIKAFEYTLASDKRIDRLQLFSPAFFQNRTERFKKRQKLYFEEDRESYISNFLENARYPSNIDLEKYKKTGTEEELDEILNYRWEEEKIDELCERSVDIEVFLGGKDKIIDPHAALDFFMPFSNVYFMQNKGHLLR